MIWSCFWHLVIGVLTWEVWSWGLTINEHASWMRTVSDKDVLNSCFHTQWPRVYMASVMATALSMCCALYWADGWWTWADSDTHNTQWLISAIQLSHIHFFAIIARCTCLEHPHWPLLSKIISCLLDKTGAWCNNVPNLHCKKVM